jgi:MFS family permease
LTSLPSLLGNLSQLLTLRAMRRWSRKRITLLGVTSQALSLLFLIGVGALYFTLGIRSQLPSLALIAVYTFLALSGAFANPAWSSWMKDVVTRDIGAYFSRRNRIAGAVSLTCMLAAGFVLDYFKHTHIYLGFCILFLVAFAGRMVSRLLLLRQHEPHFQSDDSAYFTLLQFLRRMRGNNFGRFAIFTSLFSLTTQMGSPFINVYMLKNLHFSYTQYTIVTLASAITALVVLPSWGWLTDRYGSLQIIRLSGMFIPVVALLWFGAYFIEGYSSRVMMAYLIGAQVFAGIVWTGFELATGNFIYDAVTRQRMAICVCYYSILNGFGALVGAFLGGFISSSVFTFFGTTPLHFIFLLSGLGRGAVYLLMVPKLKEVRPVAEFSMREAGDRIFGGTLRRYFDMFKTSFLRRMPF